MPGTLYVVGTPIGNLGDISARALETLQKVDFIAAEDTRVSLNLLRRFEIEKALVSYHEHNRHSRGEHILGRLLAGESCALISDAGMPAISDPGEELVKLCAEHGVPVAVVPGPTAVISALALSGLPTGRFAFEGFLSVKRRSRSLHLEAVRDDPRTLVFYEAPHKLISTLRDMLEVLGDRRVALARELTKLHEEVIRTTLSGALELYASASPRGEYVLVVEGAPKAETQPASLEDAVQMALGLVAQGMAISQAAKAAAKETGQRKADIYKAVLEAEEREEA